MADHNPFAHAAPTTTDPEYASTPPDAGHEHTDANVWIIVKFTMWLAVAAVLVHFGIGLMFGLFVEQREETGEPQFPLAVGQQQRLPAAPRLQQFPAIEVYEFRRREDDVLSSYGWVDRNAGTVHIPISEAMRQAVERGLPSRAQQPQPDAAGPVDLLPADSSAGRTMERRR